MVCFTTSKQRVKKALESIKKFCKSVLVCCSRAMASVRKSVSSVFRPVRNTAKSLAIHYGNLLWNGYLVYVVEGCGWAAGLLVWGNESTNRIHQRASFLITYYKAILAGVFLLLLVTNSVKIVGTLCFTGSLLFEVYFKVLKPKKTLPMRACEAVAEGSLALVHLGPSKALKLRKHKKLLKSAPGFYIKAFIIRFAMAVLEDMCVSTIFPLLLVFVINGVLLQYYLLNEPQAVNAWLRRIRNLVILVQMRLGVCGSFYSDYVPQEIPPS